MESNTVVIDRGVLQVFTHKAGVLARAAHDLRLSVGRFRIQVTDDRLSAWFDPNSLSVDGVVDAGVVDAHALSEKDKKTIERTVRDEILATRDYPRADYEGRVVDAGSTLRVEGRLSLRGHQAPLSVGLVVREGELVLETTLTPSRWGIRPYKALFGAIQLEDRVDVVLRVPDPRDGRKARGA